MTRKRPSTTVHSGRLASARVLTPAQTDAALMDRALDADLAAHRAAEIDDAYAVYDQMPLSMPDEWGDLESWRAAVPAS